MRTCPKCNNAVPYRIRIDGKLRFLVNRKYCLVCSPFESHNTRRLNVTTPIERSHVCTKCDRPFVSKRKGSICGSCIVAKARLKRKQRAVEYKGGKCQRCGYDRCLGALTFHHRDPAEKEFGFSSGWNQSWERSQFELDKCDLLCTNCHAEEHWKVV